MQSQHFSELQLLLQYLARYQRCDIYLKFTKWCFSRQSLSIRDLARSAWKVKSYARR